MSQYTTKTAQHGNATQRNEARAREQAAHVTVELNAHYI